MAVDRAAPKAMWKIKGHTGMAFHGYNHLCFDAEAASTQHSKQTRTLPFVRLKQTCPQQPGPVFHHGPLALKFALLGAGVLHKFGADFFCVFFLGFIFQREEIITPIFGTVFCADFGALIYAQIFAQIFCADFSCAMRSF